MSKSMNQLNQTSSMSYVLLDKQRYYFIGCCCCFSRFQRTIEYEVLAAKTKKLLYCIRWPFPLLVIC